MPLNPAIRQETVNSPIQRANPLNDPNYVNQQGYNNYDLVNSHVITPRWGEVTPMSVYETVGGDRHMNNHNTLTILNQIEGNLVSKVNEYHDTVYVPMRVVYPINYVKMKVNPTQGDDLPWQALPQIPLLYFLRRILLPHHDIKYVDSEGNSDSINPDLWNNYDALDYDGFNAAAFINSVLYVSQVLSRGQLLDYLNYQLDSSDYDSFNLSSRVLLNLQMAIDRFYDAIVLELSSENPTLTAAYGIELDPGSDEVYYVTDSAIPNASVKHLYELQNPDLSIFRGFLSDCFEDGNFIQLHFSNADGLKRVLKAAADLRGYLMKTEGVLSSKFSELPSVDAVDPFVSKGFMNPLRPAAYQLSVVEYMSNDSIDNIYNTDLFMQNLRAHMFPSTVVGAMALTTEPTFSYNGVDTEYDLLTTGAWRRAFFSGVVGEYSRSICVISLLFFLRRSLRYGDMFATGRPQLLAVGDYKIPLDEDNLINPVLLAKGTLMSRYLQFSNVIGRREVSTDLAFFGVKSSDHGARPYFVAHRRLPLDRNITTNTADNQGAQTTNLLGKGSASGYDVFIDDFGVVISMISFDVLPMYTSGIDRNFTLKDRFDHFNSMLQNVGDQEIELSELTGTTSTPQQPFAYTTRYAQYKFGVSRVHGAAVNGLHGSVFKYPPIVFHADHPSALSDLHINPDFIRDKPQYFDQLFRQRTGLSPGQYYHFLISVENQHNAARKMQYQSSILF